MSQILRKDECNYLDVARFVGIYLVVLGHFHFSDESDIISKVIFSFHMPLFFIISGLLHQSKSLSWKNILQLAYSLLIPYFLYTFVAFGYELLNGVPVAALRPWIKSMLLASGSMNTPIWFFITLLQIKLVCLCLQTRISYILLSCLFILLFLLINEYDVGYQYRNMYRIESFFLAFPFFITGYLLKNALNRSSQLYVTAPILLILLYISYQLVQFQEFDMYKGKVGNNILVYYGLGILISFAIIFLAKNIIGFVKCNFIKDMSRGSMLIVGLHLFLMYQVFPLILWVPQPLHKVILFSILLFLFFYPLIKLTYNRIPILYGKKFKK